MNCKPRQPDTIGPPDEHVIEFKSKQAIESSVVLLRNIDRHCKHDEKRKMLDEAQKGDVSVVYGFSQSECMCESQSAADGASRCRSYHLAVGIHCDCQVTVYAYRFDITNNL